MSTLIIDYSELQTIATNATSLASKAENYCNELNSNVYSAFGSVTAGVNDVLSSAMYYVAAKQKSLTEKAEEYARFAGNVCTLIEHAKQADQDVATKIENNQEDFLKKHSEIQAAEGIEAFLLNLFVEVKNACPLFEIVADCYIAVFDTLDSAFDALKYFYECGGGKELLNIVIAVAVAVVAVATFIACFPLSLAFSWAGLVALATVIGSGIAAVNAITDVLTSTRALESRLNGDPAWASIYGKQDKFSDVLRDTNFGSGTLNKLSYGAATTIDTVETVCDVICVADMAKDFYKAGPHFSESLGFGNVGAETSETQKIVNKVDSGEIKLTNNMQKGNYGEMKMDIHFENQGYERISLDRVTDLNAPTHRGIDGVYYKSGGKPPYVIAEAKYGSSRLGKTKDGLQMSHDWITGSDRLKNAVGKQKYREIMTDGYQRILVNVKKDGTLIEKVLD